MHNSVIVFAKYPRPGNVKTRLAAGIGDIAATAFYKECAEQLFARFSTLTTTISVHIFCDDPGDRAAMQQWTGNQFAMHVQRGSNLGARMFNAFTELFQLGAERVAIVGTDIPDLSAAHIESGFKLLDTHDVVLGPSRDGGYYLLAMKAPLNIFQKITWSTDTVAAETREQIVAAGLSLVGLEELHDVDTVEDFRLFEEMVRGRSAGINR